MVLKKAIPLPANSSAYFLGTAIDGKDGTFVIIPANALPVGTGSLSLSAKAPGTNVAVPSDQTVAVVVPAQQAAAPVVALVTPDAPTSFARARVRPTSACFDATYADVYAYPTRPAFDAMSTC